MCTRVNIYKNRNWANCDIKTIITIMVLYKTPCMGSMKIIIANIETIWQNVFNGITYVFGRLLLIRTWDWSYCVILEMIERGNIFCRKKKCLVS